VFLGGWSPDGERLVYYAASVSRSLAWVCIIGVDGSNLEVLTSEPEGWDVEPVWSPDGRRIAIRSHRDGAPEIYVLDLETGEWRNLTNNPAADLEPEWSPDGNWIAFASNRDNPNFDIFIMRRDGSDVRRLTTDEAKDSYPVWAP
jgi:TolB protein